jgi:hypothetical protein
VAATQPAGLLGIWATSVQFKTRVLVTAPVLKLEHSVVVLVELIPSRIRVLVNLPVLLLQLMVVRSDPSRIHVLIAGHALVPVVPYPSMNLASESHHALV